MFQSRSEVFMKKITLTIFSWLLVLCAPACMMKLEPWVVQLASVFTIMGIALDWVVKNRPEVVGLKYESIR